MLTVRLHGHLEEKYGSEFKFEASTVREVIDALQANFSDFTEEFIKDGRAYSVVVDSEAQELEACYMPINTNSTIDIIPAIGGAGFGKALGLIFVAFLLLFPPTAAAIGGAIAGGGGAFAGAFGAVLQGASAAAVISGTTTLAATLGALTAVGLQAVAWGLALAGVASLLAGPDGPDGGGERSSSLNRTDNIVGQGVPIPIGYGRLLVASVVISASYTSSWIQVIPAYTYEDTIANTWVDKHLSFGKDEDLSGFVPGYRWDDGYESPANLTAAYSNYVGYSPAAWAELVAYWEIQVARPTVETVNYAPPSSEVIVPITAITPISNNGPIADYSGDVRS